MSRVLSRSVSIVLSFVLVITSMAGSIATVSANEIDNTKLNIVVQDESGKAVPNATVTYKNGLYATAFNGYTDSEGKMTTVLSTAEYFHAGDYELSVKSNINYSILTKKTITVSGDSGNLAIDKVDGKPYTGSVVLVVKKNSSVSIDNTKLVVNVKDSNNKPVKGVKLEMKDEWGNGGEIGTSNDDGVIYYKLDGSATGDLSLTLSKDSTDYKAVETHKVDVSYSGGQYIVTKVDGKAYTGSMDFVVSKIGGTTPVEPVEAKLESVAGPANGIDPEAKTATLTVKGTNLPEKFKVKATPYWNDGNEDISGTATAWQELTAKAGGSATERTVEVTLPAKMASPTVKWDFALKTMDVTSATVKCTVNAKAAAPVEPVEAKLESVTGPANGIDPEAKTATLTVKGTNLPEKFKVKATPYWNDGNEDISGTATAWQELTAKAGGSATERTVEVTLPAKMFKPTVKWDFALKTMDVTSATAKCTVNAKESVPTPEFDKTKLNIVVQDESGKAVPNATVTYKSGLYANPFNGYTDSEGKMTTVLSTDEYFSAGDYELSVKSNINYSILTKKTITVSGDSGNLAIDKVDGKPYTGSVVLVVKKNSSTAIDNTKLVVNVKDSNNKPVKGIKVEMQDEMYNGGVIGTSNDEGVISYDVTGFATGVFTLKIHKDTAGYKVVKTHTIDVSYLGGQFVVSKVDGNAYIGSVDFVVNKIGGTTPVEPAEAKLESVAGPANGIDPEAKTATLTVKGTNLPEKFKVNATPYWNDGTYDVAGTATGWQELTAKAGGSATERTVEVTLPAKMASPTVKWDFALKTMDLTSTSVKCTVNAKAAAPVEPSEPKLESVTGPAGGINPNAKTGTLTVKGTNLPEKFKVKVTPYWNDGTEDISGTATGWQELTAKAGGSATERTIEVTLPTKMASPTVKWEFAVRRAELASETVKCTVDAKDSAALPEVDKTDLNKVIAAAEKLNKADYTDATWKPFAEALATANTVKAKENATQDEVNKAKLELIDAQGKLEKKPVESESAKVTSITATPNKLSFKGGEVTINAQGVNLTADNWGFDAVAYISGSDMQRDVSWSVKEQTADHVTLVIPQNAMTNDLEFRVSAGVWKNEDSFDAQATTTFMIEKKPYKSDSIFNAESAQLIADNKVQINFEKKYELYCKDDEAAGLFSILDAKGRDLGCKATAVTFDENSAIVTFETALSKDAAFVGFDEGIFDLGKDKNGKWPLVNGSGKIILTRKASISSIDIEKEVFRSNGGTVKATLDGFNVDSINVDDITAKVFDAGVSSASDDITVDKTNADGKIVLKFDVPANKNELTKCYILKVYHDGKEVIVGASRESRNVISVLPEGKTEADQTLGMATISAMNSPSTDLKHAVANVSSQLGSLKSEIRLYGTNLDVEKTMLRAHDENGILWPVYDIPECDGTWRFTAIAGTSKNGVFGDGNAQLVELLPPRYAGTNKTYTIDVSIDGGKTWLSTCPVKLTINNDGITGESDFRECNKKDIRTITVKYVDESGKEIAEADKYQGYGITMLGQFNIAPKNIEGYTLDKEPNLPDWVQDGPDNYEYVYKSNATKPEPGPTPGGGGAVPSIPSKDPITNNKENGNTTTDVNLGDKVTTENGKTDVKVDKELADKVVENATNNKSESVNLNAGTTAGNTAKTELALPTDTYKDIAGKTDVKKVTVKTDGATVSMDKETIVAVAEQAGTAAEVKLVIETKESAEDKVVIELKLVTSNGEIHDFKGGKVTVTVPVKNASGKKLVAVYIDENGKYTKLGGELTSDKKTFVFETGHFSTYAVITEEAADAAIKAQEPAKKPVVKSVALTSVKAQKKAMKVIWKKSANKVSGYQVRYSTSKSFKASKTLSVKYTKKVNSKTVKKLKSGKRYYVKVRAYVKNADGTYYSKWSKVKSVKIK